MAGTSWFGFPVHTPHEVAKTQAVETLRTYDTDPIIDGPDVITGATWNDGDETPPQIQVRIVTGEATA